MIANIIDIIYNKMRAHIILLVLLLCKSAASSEDQEQQQFRTFAEQLADFLPDQAFEFQLAPSDHHTFMLWPPHDTSKLRGMFYITSDEVDGLDMECIAKGTIQKSFKDKKIGVFSVPFDGDGDLKLTFRSEAKNLKIYLSYQFVLGRTKKPRPPSPENVTEAESDLSQCLQKFNRVRNALFGQEQILKSIMKSEMRETDKLRDEISTKITRVVIETIVIIVSGVVSVMMLRKEFKKGYQLVV